MEELLVFLELLGTAAFAVSGAMTALRKSLDPLGVVVLGLITAVGGGVLRDLLLGITPPKIFDDPLSVSIAVAVSVAAHFRWSLPRPRYRKNKKTSVLQTEVFSAYQKKPRRVCRPQAAKK